MLDLVSLPTKGTAAGSLLGGPFTLVRGTDVPALVREMVLRGTPGDGEFASRVPDDLLPAGELCRSAFLCAAGDIPNDALVGTGLLPNDLLCGLGDPLMEPAEAPRGLLPLDLSTLDMS
jgi:hypothetical protein